MKDYIEYKEFVLFLRGKCEEEDIDIELDFVFEDDGVKVYEDDGGEFYGLIDGVWYFMGCLVNSRSENIL